MTCPNCQSDNVTLQVVNEKQSTGCITILLYLILLVIPIIGWITLVYLLFKNNHKTKTYGVCNNCGNRFNVLSRQDIKDKKKNIIYTIILLLIIVWVVFSFTHFYH